MSEPVSPLGGEVVEDALIGIQDAGPIGQMTLRGEVAGSAFAVLLLELTGGTVPDTLSVTVKGETRAVWMSPDELLLVLPRERVAPAVARAGEVLSGGHHMALDVSDARALIQLSGAMVPEILAKGVPCDVSDRGFPVGTARRTHLAGLAIGLALQGTLSNVAAGVMIIIFRPFKLEDFIAVNGEMGTVKDITLNFTEIASIGNVQIIVPNSVVWGNTITNYSAYPLRRAEWQFGVGYGANLADAERAIRDTIMADPRSLSDPEPFIQVNNLNASSVDFLVRVWVSSADFFSYQADMKRAVKEALDAHGVDIPFPTRTVFMEKAGD